MKALHIARAGTAASAGGYTPPAVPTYAEEVLADGPLGLWLMDEASGTTVVDSSPNLADGTYSGGIVLAGSGPYSQPAAVFSGDQASLPIDLSGTNKMTWEAWVYIDAYDNADKVLSELTTTFNSSNGFLLNPCASASPGLFDIAWHGADFASVTMARPSAATWHHISISIDRALTPAGGAVVAYVDGAPVSVTPALTGSGTGNWASANLFVGARSGVVAPLTCRIWGLAIYDFILSGARRTVHAATAP